jgi:hypothetical protein
MTLQRYGLVEGSRIVKRRVCSYDRLAVPDPCFVLKDTVGEMYFCNLRCFCVWSVQLAIVLCKKKNTALVEITLPQDANIHAREYQLYLPSKEELQQKLAEWIEEQTTGGD